MQGANFLLEDQFGFRPFDVALNKKHMTTAEYLYQITQTWANKQNFTASSPAQTM
jgi:hypothetical protein